MKKSFLYLIVALGLIQLSYSCTPKSKIPFLAKMNIYADSLIDEPFPDSLNYTNRGLKLTKEQCYALCSDSLWLTIVSIKKINDKYLIFFNEYQTDVRCALFNEQGKIIDWCDFCGAIAPSYCYPKEKGIIRIERHIEADSLDCEQTIWNIKYIDNNKFETKVIINDSVTVTRLYSVSDKITLLSKTESKHIDTPAYDIITTPISQAKDICDKLTTYKELRKKSDYGCTVLRRLFEGNVMINLLKYNAKDALQWIYDHRTNKRMEFYVKDACSHYPGHYDRSLSINFLKSQILQLKDKQAQEYLLKMPVFTDNDDNTLVYINRN